MARIPKYAYRVLVHVRLHTPDGLRLRIDAHNYETLPGAWAYRTIALSKPHTQKVEVLVILDESTPAHQTGS